MMREALSLSEQEKLRALREAARVGIEAVERGEFTKFADTASLVAHLDALAEQALGSQLLA